jgi:hypothetical protein|eukprot:CAMPEP_0174287438 /NCGR_PEP_ID=MMETSP0809-20121228/16100_1 /TAXON_ID=73025 ORGANISM="Eutreptiella gymnastica-like, Strain CCMP1594" /NCGR_SAMPLE_ID=MMETSP0809 /ASSEMBLY_ACC=CAM_ASM_000658 /LENGTH=396 /DNA_ID=CAMNT_0015383999 /DNA_START=36 /DNA_END=1226 /DNA_ORIENTATION=-
MTGRMGPGSLSSAALSPLMKSDTWGSGAAANSTASSNFGGPENTKTRLTNLSNKLNDIDVDLANHTRTNKSFKGKLDTVQTDLEAHSKSQRKLQNSLADAEERLQRLENALMAEKSARELAGKKLQRLLEERVVKLADMLENEQEERAKEMDTLRARLRFLEERNKQLELELQDHGKQVNTISKTTIPKLTGNIDTLMKVSHQEKLKGSTGGDGDLARKFMVSVSNMEIDIHAERTARDHDTNVHKTTIQNQMIELKQAVEAEQREREVMHERVIAPVWEEVRKLQMDLEKERMSREHNVADHAQGLLEKLNLVKTNLAKSSKSIDEQQTHRLKEVDDRLWKLQTQFEQEVMDRQQVFLDIENQIGAEKADRTKSEEQVLTILDQLSDKVKASLGD